MGRWRVLAMVWLLACAAPRGSQSAVANEKEQEKPVWRRSCSEFARAPVSLEYEDTPGGAAVVYRTKGDVAALRWRTHEVARFHNSAQSKLGALHDLSAIPHRARVEPVEDGARLLLLVKSVRRQALDALRMHVQQDVFTLQRTGCGTGQEAL